METTHTFFGILAGILAFGAAVPYILDTLRGNTKPERAAFIIWSLTSTVTFFSYWANGAKGSLWLAFGDFIVGAVMLALAFKFGYGWVKRRDTVGISVAIFGVLLWLITDEPFLALLLSVGIDAVGSTLVIIKSYEAPNTEHLGSWLIYFAASVLAILAIDEFTLPILFFPVYALLSAAGIVLAILIGRRRKHRGHTSSKRTEKIA